MVDVLCRVLVATNVNVNGTFLGSVIDGQAIASGDNLFLLNQANPNERNVWSVQVNGTLQKVLQSMDPMWLVIIEQGTYAANSYRWEPVPAQWVLQGTSTIGINGSTWYSGAGAPGAIGVNGDFYLNTSTSDIYQKSGGSWGSPISNIKGGTGTNGSTWYQGSGAPAGGTGNNGDFYLNTATGDICTVPRSSRETVPN